MTVYNHLMLTQGNGFPPRIETLPGTLGSPLGRVASETKQSAPPAGRVTLLGMTLVISSIVALCFAFSVAAQVSPAVVTPTQTLVLFNGRDLEGWYTWLQDEHYGDPKHVFRIQNGMLLVSGEEWGGLTSKNAYQNYHLVVEWKWGGPNLGPRAGHARDSGILVHGTGADGGHEGIWLQSIESQIIEGGTGDFILVEGREQTSMTAQVHELDKQFYWDEKGSPQTLERGRFNWFGRDPHWQDQLDYRGPQDVEKPVGEWNRQEVVADRDTLTNIVNGVVVNQVYRVSPAAGKIQIQSEGAQILFRRIELRPLDRTQKTSR